jgi:chorismate synthase
VVAVADMNGDGVPDLIWQNDATRQVTVNYYGGAGGATMTGWAWLNSAGNHGWTVVAAADMNGDGVPDLIWQNDTTRQVTVNYYGGTGGATMTGWAWLNSGGNPGWTVVAAADMNGDGVPDLIWQNDATRQVTVNYYGGAQGATLQGWAWLNSAGVHGWQALVSP